MKPGPELEQRRYPTSNCDASGVRVEDAGDQLEHGAFARSVRSDHPKRGPGLDLEGNATQYPELVVDAAAAPDERLLQ